jgi:DNA-binding transcriptional LysR family regulator
MELRHLSCFVAVSEYLSFTEAAEKLHIVQSAVSHNIAELEKELNAKLFFRNKQSIALTPVGELLLDNAYRILAMERDTITNIKLRMSGITGTLSIGYVFVPVAWCMFDKFKAFSRKYSQVRLKYNSFNDINIARQLSNFDLDIGFARLATITDQTRINWHPIYREHLQIVVSEEHPLADLKSASLEQFKNDPLILMSHKSNPVYMT